MGDADDLSAEMIFCHAAGDVCVMMLHRKLSLDGGGERHARASGAWMQVVCYGLRRNLEEILHLFEVSSKKYVVS